MEVNVMKRTNELGRKLAEIGEEASCIKENVAEAFEEGRDNAKRALKRGRRKAEDALESAAYQVKRRPLQSVGITFGVGLVCGLAAFRTHQTKTRGTGESLPHLFFFRFGQEVGPLIASCTCVRPERGAGSQPAPTAAIC
jgi:ElaB/YqjD/DUF883 family membrane-anchored ribosome-binding protein